MCRGLSCFYVLSPLEGDEKTLFLFCHFLECPVWLPGVEGCGGVWRGVAQARPDLRLPQEAHGFEPRRIGSFSIRFLSFCGS